MFSLNFHVDLNFPPVEFQVQVVSQTSPLHSKIESNFICLIPISPIIHFCVNSRFPWVLRCRVYLSCSNDLKQTLLFQLFVSISTVIIRSPLWLLLNLLICLYTRVNNLERKPQNMKEFANEMLYKLYYFGKIMLLPVLTNFWTISSNCEFVTKSNFCM